MRGVTRYPPGTRGKRVSVHFEKISGGSRVFWLQFNNRVPAEYPSNTRVPVQQPGTREPGTIFDRASNKWRVGNATGATYGPGGVVRGDDILPYPQLPG